MRTHLLKVPLQLFNYALQLDLQHVVLLTVAVAHLRTYMHIHTAHSTAAPEQQYKHMLPTRTCVLGHHAEHTQEQLSITLFTATHTAHRERMQFAVMVTARQQHRCSCPARGLDATPASPPLLPTQIPAGRQPPHL
jgi:hypothetical protein